MFIFNFFKFYFLVLTMNNLKGQSGQLTVALSRKNPSSSPYLFWSLVTSICKFILILFAASFTLSPIVLYCIVDQSLKDFGPHSPIQISKRGLGIDLGTIVQKASILAKNAYAAASSPRKSDGEILPLKCCLMSISLPWEHIAHDLLFKVSVFRNISAQFLSN